MQNLAKYIKSRITEMSLTEALWLLFCVFYIIFFGLQDEATQFFGLLGLLLFLALKKIF